MNWLEIGCPYCPTVLTVPRTAAGRDVRCPECGKSYLVPEPKHAPSAYEVTTHLPMLPATMEEVEFEELAAAAVAKTAPAAVPASVPMPMPQAAVSAPPQPTVPRQEPVPPAPAAAASPEVVPPRPTSLPIAATDAPPPTPAVPRVRRRSSADELMYPELEKDSPLPEVEILLPPGRHSPQLKKPESSPPATAQAAMKDLAPPANPGSYGTQTMDAGRPPLGPPPPLSAAEEAAAMEEVQQRIRRHRKKALLNLAAFVVGIVVMTAFAFLVVRFSRPS